MADAANNYMFSYSLAFPLVFVKPNSDLQFKWADLRHDIRGRELDPQGDIDMVTLLMWNGSETELAEKISSDSVASNDLVLATTFYTENESTSGSLIEMTSFGLETDPESLLAYVDPNEYAPNDHTYTLMAATGTALGEGTRMVQAFQLDPTSDNTTVALTDDSTQLSYSADIQSAQPTLVPADVANLQFSWSGLQHTALGGYFEPASAIGQVVVAKYSRDVAGLEQHFLDLDVIADEWYSAPGPFPDGVALSSLRQEDGTRFGGIDVEGTWLIALLCDVCGNPAPWYLSVLEPCPSY